MARPRVDRRGEKQRAPGRPLVSRPGGRKPKEQDVDEQRTVGHEAMLKRPEESIKDLEPDEPTSESVRGGDGLKLGGVAGDSPTDALKNNIEVVSL